MINQLQCARPYYVANIVNVFLDEFALLNTAPGIGFE